jgi:hypothetical protein
MGDAGIQAENEIMKDGYNVDADILKDGHHGNRTASGTPFISAMSPEISVIKLVREMTTDIRIKRLSIDCRRFPRYIEPTWTAQLL